MAAFMYIANLLDRKFCYVKDDDKSFGVIAPTGKETKMLLIKKELE
jgi:hypothetical protein